jgi:broad specificity phosphatase PhoE
MLNQNFDLIILSPLRRAIETFEFSNIKAEEIRISYLFRETMDGGSWNYLEKEYMENKKIESSDDLYRRATYSIEHLRSLDPKYKNVAVITHGSYVNYILQQLIGMQFNFQNAHFMTVTV